MNSPPLLLPHTSTSLTKHRKIKYAKALGYIIDPCIVVEEAVKNGTAIEDQFGRTFVAVLCGHRLESKVKSHTRQRSTLLPIEIASPSTVGSSTMI